MQIDYYIEKQYGVDRRYIVQESVARQVRMLTRRMTLEESDIKALEALGMTLKEVLKPRN